MVARFQSVLSIGPQCLTSTLLQRAGLKTFSGPFDWIFSSLDMVCDCIETDFADFLNIDFLKPIPPDRRPDPSVGFANHLLYGQRYGLSSIFNHYDPRDAERYAYLRRCVKRMRAALASREPQLLLAIGRRDAFATEPIERWFRLLDERTVHVTARLIAVEPPACEQFFDGHPGERGRHQLDRFVPYSTIDGIMFADDRDNEFLVAQLRSRIALQPSERAVTP